jgi:hypothetical protein
MSATSTLKFKATKGKQKPESVEGSATDVLTRELTNWLLSEATVEQAGLTATLAQKYEEPVEINAAY